MNNSDFQVGDKRLKGKRRIENLNKAGDYSRRNKETVLKSIHNEKLLIGIEA
jgi:hypothetical protein